MNVFFSAFIIISAFFASTIVFAQIYNNRAEEITGPMDNVIISHDALYNSVPNPGDKENAEPQENRYVDMTNAMDKAGIRHLDSSNRYRTIEETTPHLN